MRTYTRIAAALVGMLTSLGCLSHAQITVEKPQPATVTVHISAQGTGRIPDTIFGSFLEPIGNSINNGLSAEILVNRSLEGGLWNHVNLETLYREQPELIESSNTTGIPIPWQSLNKAAGNRFELHVGQAANSWQSLEILGQPQQLTGIMQRIHLPVPRALVYQVSFYAKHMSGPTGVVVSLRDASSDRVFAESHVATSGKNWSKYSTTLRLQPGSVERLQPVRFGLAVEGDERLEVDQISLVPDDAIDGFDPDEVSLAKAMHVTELRFGGNFSSYYHWHDGIGPEDKRSTMQNIAWGIPEYNNFGTDEFLRFCSLIGAVPQFNLNMGSGTPEEAAAWVQYIRSRYQGRVIYELGNELYGKWQVGYPTLEELGARTLAFSKAVRAVAPDAELIATGETHNAKWNDTQLGLPTGTFDSLSLHTIYGMNHPLLEPAGPSFTAAADYAAAPAIGLLIDEAAAQIASHPETRGKVHLAVTEWLFNSKGFGERNFTNEAPSWMNEGGAVLAASFLNQVLRRSDSVTITNMTGLMEFAGIWKRREQVYAVPAYYAFQMYTQVKGDTLLPVTSDSGTYSLRGGVRQLEAVDAVPYIDVVATRSADNTVLTLLCVNRSLDRDSPVHFDLGAFRAAEAQGQQIKAESRYERNDEVEPSHVRPIPVTAVIDTGTSVNITLPHESVTVLRLRAK